MNDYKHNLICLVQKTPLLWDPKNKDYKNKDQRKHIERLLQFLFLARRYNRHRARISSSDESEPSPMANSGRMTCDMFDVKSSGNPLMSRVTCHA